MSKTLQVSKHDQRRRNQFPYKIIIVCRNEPEIVESKALSFLRMNEIPTSSITLCIQNKLKDVYSPYLKKWSLSSLYFHENPKDAIFKFYPPGTLIVCMSDAIGGFVEITRKFPFIKSISSFQTLLQRGFLECEKNQCFFWNVFPDWKEIHMNPDSSLEPQKAVLETDSSFWGCIHTPNLKNSSNKNIRLNYVSYVLFEKQKDKEAKE